MEENKVSTSSIQQIDDLLLKLDEMYRNHNYSELQHSLNGVKSKMELMPYQESKYFLKHLIPFLIKVFNFLEENINDNDVVIQNIKSVSIDIFSKVIWDNELIEVYSMVIDFIPKILTEEREDLAIKAMKLFLEYYKNMKTTLGWGPVEKFLEFTLFMYKNFENIYNENYAIMCKENISNDRIFMKATKSFKVMNEFPLIIMLTYNIFSEPISETVKRNVHVIVSVLKVLKLNPHKDTENDLTKKIQNSIYEDYLYTLTKLVYLVAFLVKINDKYENIFKPYAEDIVNAVIHILDNTPKETISTRKEILSITKNLIKPFANIFYEKKDYFRNENNLLGKSVTSHEYIVFEANKIIFTLIDNISPFMSLEEKAACIQELILKINNYKIGYEFKLFMFYYIHSMLDSLKSSTDLSIKWKLITINNSILKELGIFFHTLSKIFTNFENYYTFNLNVSERRADYLDKYFFETEESEISSLNSSMNMGSSSPKQNMNTIQQTNINKVYELILNNEYEKYINTDELKFMYDLLKHFNGLIRLCVSIIHLELSIYNSEPRSALTTQNFALSNKKKVKYLKKIFKSYVNFCEKLFKNHSHNNVDEGSAKLYEISLVNVYVTLPTNLCCTVFQSLMSFIFKAILRNSKVCQVKNCFLNLIIDTIFDSNSSSGADQIQSTVQATIRRDLFDIFLDFYINKINYIGNNFKTYDDNYQYISTSMSVIINIFKSLFKYLSFLMEEKTKIKITNFLVNCLILTKNSKFFGNYIYIIRCLFKNLLNITNQGNQMQFEFYKETIHLVYGLMKYLINIKEDFPFLKEMLTEIIMIFPIKFKYMIDYAKVVFPSLVDALNMNQEIIPVGLQYLEQWMNALFHKPENVKPFLQSNINLLTTLLTSHLYRNYAISLNSLKLLSKFGGRSRNYLEDKMINPKTSPTNVLIIDLMDISSGKKIEFPIDNIVDLCIKIVTNYKRHTEKNWLNQIKTSFRTLKACFLTFIDDEISYDYLMSSVNSIRNFYEINDDYNVRGYFKKVIFSDEQIKINSIYRKAEHFLVEKLLRGLFLCCTIPEIDDDIRDFVKFICDYFVVIIITKNMNNKYINVFEIDPTIIIDIICEFLFSNNPTVFKNNNQTCISIAIKLINQIIDTIDHIFDKNSKIIENLEIVDIIFLKFLNTCYNNEWSKKGGGMVVILILIRRFSKDITFKYLKQIIRAVFLVTNHYSSIVKIKYEVDCEIVINELISMFILSVDEKKVSHDIEITKDFEQMYHALNYFQDEILNNIHSMSEYARKMSLITFKLIQSNVKFKKCPILFMLIDRMDVKEFWNYYGEITIDKKGKFLNNLYSQQDMPSNNMENSNESSMNKKFLKLIKEVDSKIVGKINYLISCLCLKLDLNSSNFLPLLSYCSALRFIIKQFPNYFIDIILSECRLSMFVKMIKNLINILITDMFLYIEITKKIHDIQFNSKFKYFFIEKFYSTKQLYLNLNIKVNDEIIEIDNEIPDKYMNDVLKSIFQGNNNYIFEQYIQNNSNYTSIDPYLCEIFPMLSCKMKMMRNFIKLLKNIFSNRRLFQEMKGGTEIKSEIKIDQSYDIQCDSHIEKSNMEKLIDLKNVCTTLLFRFIIYREEKVILKESKKYIKKLLKVQSSPKNLLPEEELKKCIKPVLEQIAQNKLISYKFSESLAILIKLLSMNFNETLGKKLQQSIEEYLKSADSGTDFFFLHSIISLFSHLNTIQIKDLFSEILDVIFRIERESIGKPRNSIFNSKYKSKIIKLISNFSDVMFHRHFSKITSNDYTYFLFFKNLIKQNESYVIRENFAKNYNNTILPEILLKSSEVTSSSLTYMKFFKSLVKKSPGIIKMFSENLIFKLNSYFEKNTINLYYNSDMIESDLNIDKMLSIIANIHIIYLSTFNDKSIKVNLIYSLLFYQKRSRRSRIQEKIKLFLTDYIHKKVDKKLIRMLLNYFVQNYNNFLKLNTHGDVLKYLINPILIQYIRCGYFDDFVDRYFVNNLMRSVLNDENKKNYDDLSNLEIIKLIIIVISHFINPARTNIKEYQDLNNSSIYRDDNSGILYNLANYLTYKYSLNYSALCLYCCLGLSLASYIFNKQGDRILSSLNMFLYRPIHYDHLNIINLCYDIIIPFCMTKLEDSVIVIKNLKLLYDKSLNTNQFYHIFSIILRFSDMFVLHKLHIANIIIQFAIKSTQQYVNSTFHHKKMIVQLIGLVIYWFKTEKSECDERSNQIDRLKENTFVVLMKYYKIVISQKDYDYEYVDICKRYLLYLRELIKISEFNIKKFFFIHENDNQGIGMKLFLNPYLHLLKLGILYCKKDNILTNIDYFFSLLRTLNMDPSINIKATNEAILIMRCVIDENNLNKLCENKEAVSEEVKLRKEIQVVKYIRDFYESHQNIFKQKKGKILMDIEFENIYAMDIKNTEIMKDLLNNVKSKTHTFNPEKLLEIFPHFDYRYFALFHFYINQKIKNNYNNSNEMYNNENFEAVFKLNESLSKLYFEFWYIYALLVLQLLKEEEDRLKKQIFDSVEYDYFSSGSNFFSFLKVEEQFEKLKFEKNPKIPNLEKKTSAMELILETVLIGFYLAFQNKSITGRKMNIINALVLLVDLMNNTSVGPIIDTLVGILLKSSFYTFSDLNYFIIEVLKIFDFNTKKISTNMLNLIIEYMERYQHEYDSNVKEIIKVLLLTSRYHDYKIRKNIFKIYEKFNTQSLSGKLKWIFQIDNKQPDLDNNSWLPYSVDFLLHHFQINKPIVRKEYCSKLRRCKNINDDVSKMEVEIGNMELDNAENDKVKFPWVQICNLDKKNLRIKSLLIPIRDIVLGDISISQKMWFSIFPQVWRILSKDEQEIMGVHINDFLIYLTNLSNNQKGPIVVKAMLESISNCSPFIKLNPEIIYILAKNHNSWNSATFYLERMISANIYRERSFICLNKLMETLKEDEHSIGLKRFISQDKNKFTVCGLAFLQCGNYSKCEEIFTDAMRNYRDMIDTIKLSDDEDFDEFPNKLDFSIWESGLIESYRNLNKWNNLLALAEETNNIDIKIEALWHIGSIDKWQEIEKMNVGKYNYLAKINQIYMMMNKDVARVDSTYQQKCMECIRTIFQDFSTFPQNFEKLNYQYYLIFQMIVEAWESTNTLKEIERNINDRKASDFRENLIMWRDRIPHISEGFYSLKLVLDPRNYLFDILRDSVKRNPSTHNIIGGIANLYPNISDHIWNHTIYLKFARKLQLYDVYMEYYEKFNKDINSFEVIYPIEIYIRNMEHFKIFRKVNKNYEKGLEIANQLLLPMNNIGTNIYFNSGIENEIRASYVSTKAYFSFKLGNIIEADECFKEATSQNPTDYHIWKDWAEMSDAILLSFKEHEKIPPEIYQQWFDNSVINYLTMMIFKLNKAKYVIPRIFVLFKKFPELKVTFEKQIENVPTWIWIFWIPQVFEIMKFTNHRNFALNILYTLGKNYPQYIYYSLSVMLPETIKSEFYNNLEKLKTMIINNNIILISKIDLMTKEIGNKMTRSTEEIILTHILRVLDIQACKDTAEAKNIIVNYLSKTKLINIDNMNDIFNEVAKFVDREDVNIFSLYEMIKNWRYFIQSKLATESNFKDLSYILNNQLYNSNFDEVEIPGYFFNKIVEPTSENRVYITRFESEFSHKFIALSQKKLLIRGSNEKVYNFSVVFEKNGNNSHNKILQLQTLFNCLFASNKDTYKSNVKFIVPIKFSLTHLMKIQQEETSQYYLNEVYDFCMQKFGFDPEIAYKLYENEYRNSYPNADLTKANFHNQEIIAKVYKTMNEILPVYNLKSFIHKFIINFDEIFIFRKQFAISYAINNLFNFLLKSHDKILLNKISFNKETGSVTMHDLKFLDYKEFNNAYNLKKDSSLPFRLTKNITYFLSPSCMYGLFPGCIHAALNSIVEKQQHSFNIIFTMLFKTDLKDYDNLEEDKFLANTFSDYSDKFLDEVNLLNSIGNKKYDNPMDTILEIINCSQKEENLAKTPLNYNPWF